MLNLKECLQGVESVAILGHVRPDGDCIGSCLSLYNYIETYFPKIEAKVYLQDFMPEFLMLKNADKIVVINYGRVVETGTHDELLAKDNSIYASLYKTQIK